MYMRLLRILGAHIYILFIPSHYFGTLRLVAPFQVQTLHRYLHISASWTFYQASGHLHPSWVEPCRWSQVEATRKLRGSWVESTRLLRRGLVWDVWGCSVDFYLHFAASLRFPKEVLGWTYVYFGIILPHTCLPKVYWSAHPSPYWYWWSSCGFGAPTPSS